MKKYNYTNIKRTRFGKKAEVETKLVTKYYQVDEEISKKEVLIKVRKNKPRQCSAVRRICIKCRTSVIHKNDLNYERKICKTCFKK